MALTSYKETFKNQVLVSTTELLYFNVDFSNLMPLSPSFDQNKSINLSDLFSIPNEIIPGTAATSVIEELAIKIICKQLDPSILAYIDFNKHSSQKFKASCLG
jgi:hypothetical protein